MMSKRCQQSLAAVALGFSLVGLTGCQTQIAGMTLPSGYYLQHRPQYFPAEPSYPLPRELATMQAQNAAAAEASTAVVGRVPPPVIAPPAPPPAVVPPPVIAPPR